MSLDVPQALTGLVTSKLVNPWGDAVVHASAACRVSNPFNVSASVQAISIGIVYGGSKVGSVTMPRLDPPLALAAFSRRTGSVMQIAYAEPEERGSRPRLSRRR